MISMTSTMPYGRVISASDVKSKKQTGSIEKLSVMPYQQVMLIVKEEEDR